MNNDIGKLIHTSSSKDKTIELQHLIGRNGNCLRLTQIDDNEIAPVASIELTYQDAVDLVTLTQDWIKLQKGPQKETSPTTESSGRKYCCNELKYAVTYGTIKEEIYNNKYIWKLVLKDLSTYDILFCPYCGEGLSNVSPEETISELSKDASVREISDQAKSLYTTLRHAAMEEFRLEIKDARDRLERVCDYDRVIIVSNSQKSLSFETSVRHILDNIVFQVTKNKETDLVFAKVKSFCEDVDKFTKQKR